MTIQNKNKNVKVNWEQREITFFVKLFKVGIYSYVTKVVHVYDVTLIAVEVCWCLTSYNLIINKIILTKLSVFSSMTHSFNYMS
jgi:hypothetical protein